MTEKRKIIERLKPNHALNDLLRVAKMPRSSFYYKEVKRDYHEVKAIRCIKRTENEMVITP